MPLKKLFVVFSLCLICPACLRPDKPIVEVCQLDAFALEGICGLSGQGAGTKTARKPIAVMDKSTCFAPKEWKKAKDYYDLLEVYTTELERNCK